MINKIEEKLTKMSERPNVPVLETRLSVRKRKRGDLMKALYEDDMGKVVLRNNKPCFNLVKNFTDQGRDVARFIIELDPMLC